MVEELPDREGWMTNADKKDREHARQTIAMRVLTDRLKIYLDKQVKVLKLDPETVELAIHYMIPKEIPKKDLFIHGPSQPIIDEGEYYIETGQLFPPGITTRKEAEAIYNKETKIALDIKKLKE